MKHMSTSRSARPSRPQTAAVDACAAAGRLPAMLLLVAALLAGPAQATTELRVEARPISDPIEVFVTVTDTTGAPVGGLAAADFIVTLDGVPITIQPPDLTLPPAQDPDQKVSVVFAMDYSSSVTSIARAAMQNAVIAFIDSMNTGDYAAIIKFNNTNPAKASVVWPFTQIDQGAGSLALKTAVLDDYPGSGTNLLDAINLAIDQFVAPPSPLPAGPKAVIVITDGGESTSTVTESEVVANANDNSIPVFLVGVGDITIPRRAQLLTNLSTETSGDFYPAPSDAEIAAAYATVSSLLNNEYLITIAADAVTDCAQHTLQVTVAGQTVPVSVAFGRCDTTPDPFAFASKRNVKPNTIVTSEAVTISGIAGPADIKIAGGEYSIGCGSATFRTDSSMISNGDRVCVRHTASSAYATETLTTLTVGGVLGTFKSSTMDAPPPSSGGGGATGALELLLGLAVLLGRRRPQA